MPSLNTDQTLPVVGLSNSLSLYLLPHVVPIPVAYVSSFVTNNNYSEYTNCSRDVRTGFCQRLPGLLVRIYYDEHTTTLGRAPSVHHDPTDGST